MEYFIWSLPLLFAILNRVRGAGYWVLGIPLHTISKIVIPVMLAILIVPFSFSIEFFKLAVLLILVYKLGELWGWGKWMGTILKRYDFIEDNQEGDGDGRKSGIYYIANFFINEKANPLNNSRLALAIRGTYWWLPVLGVFYYYNAVSLPNMLVAAMVLGVWFPFSCEIARWYELAGQTRWTTGYVVGKQWGLPSFVKDSWECSEVIYGFIQGLVFTLLMNV